MFYSGSYEDDLDPIQEIFDYHDHNLEDFISDLKEYANDDVNTKRVDGTTLLMHAANKKRIVIMNHLISRGADVNLQNNFGETAFYMASLRGSPHIMRALLDAGANVHIGKSPVLTLIDRGFSKRLRLCFSAGLTIPDCHPNLLETRNFGSRDKITDLIKGNLDTPRPLKAQAAIIYAEYYHDRVSPFQHTVDNLPIPTLLKIQIKNFWPFHRDRQDGFLGDDSDDE